MNELPLDADDLRRFVSLAQAIGGIRTELRPTLIVRPENRRLGTLTDIEVDRILDEFDWTT